jgi:PIN domain nuclease of toxin-antitoxin system
MLRAVADTHAVIWYLYDDPRLSESARTLITQAASAGDEIGFSAITLAEIVYLSEKGRIHPEALGRVLTALDEPGAVL